MKESIVFNGQTVEGERLEVVSSHEPWVEYLVADGSVHRVRHVLVSLLYIEELRMHVYRFNPIYDVIPSGRTNDADTA